MSKIFSSLQDYAQFLLYHYGVMHILSVLAAISIILFTYLSLVPFASSSALYVSDIP